jgi:hypothetical protein
MLLERDCRLWTRRITTIRLHVWNNRGQTSLHPALGGGYEDMQLLQGRGADVDAQDDSYPTPLHPHGTGSEVGGVDGGVDVSDKGAGR